MKNFLLILLVLPLMINAQNDCEDCKDYSLLPRMPNFYIENIKTTEFDSQRFFYDNSHHEIEGKKIVYKYYHNQYQEKGVKFPSRLQILRNYSVAIETAGGKVLFERHNSEHGYYTFQTSEGKEIWLKIAPRRSGNSYEIFIIEREVMRQDIVIEADLIKQKIELYGKVAIYGILFDIGKSIIRAESKPALDQIAEYLKNNPTVHCWVVGHTDADGSFEINSKLSLDRATAIKVELETNYGIPMGRLFAEGVGPLAPVASNKTEEGKQLNRRVELVLK